MLGCLLFSCASQKELEVELKRDWKLIEISGFEKPILVHNDAGLNLAHYPFTIYLRCVSQRVSLRTLSHENVKMKVESHQEQLCDKTVNENLRLKFTNALNKATHYQVKGHFLTLFLNDGSALKFVAADWD